MLRITHLPRPNAIPLLRLEGKLLGPWVAELDRALDELGCPADRLTLDLAAVTFVDGPGLKLLRDLLRRGATLAACSRLVAQLLHVEDQ